MENETVKTHETNAPCTPYKTHGLEVEQEFWIMVAFNTVIFSFWLLFNGDTFDGYGFFGNIVGTVLGMFLGGLLLTPLLFFVEAPILLIAEDIYKAIKRKQNRLI